MTHVFTITSYQVEIILLLHVDDTLIAFKNKSAIDKLKKQLSYDFEMKDLREVKKVLGMKVESDRLVARFT